MEKVPIDKIPLPRAVIRIIQMKLYRDNEKENPFTENMNTHECRCVNKIQYVPI